MERQLELSLHVAYLFYTHYSTMNVHYWCAEAISSAQQWIYFDANGKQWFGAAKGNTNSKESQLRVRKHIQERNKKKHFSFWLARLILL